MDVVIPITGLRWCKAAVGTALVALLLAMAPFAVALEIHHVLAAADHDGHEHSDSDLCHWVQAHTATLLQPDLAPFQIWLAVAGYKPAPNSVPAVVRLSTAGSPRAPPLF